MKHDNKVHFRTSITQWGEDNSSEDSGVDDNENSDDFDSESDGELLNDIG